jgi:hypothetical protein
MYIYIIINMFIMRWTQPYDIVTFTLWETKSKHRSCIDATKHELARSNFVSPCTYVCNVPCLYTPCLHGRANALSWTLSVRRIYTFASICLSELYMTLYNRTVSSRSQQLKSAKLQRSNGPKKHGAGRIFFERVQVWDLNIVIFRLTRLIYNRLV